MREVLAVAPAPLLRPPHRREPPQPASRPADAASPPPPEGSASPRLPGLDAVRGLAVALVIARHAWPDAVPGGGIVGVVMFFTLSGYLITGVLLRDPDAGLRRFYARRAARLVPALLALLTGVTLVTLVLDPLGDRERLPHTLAVALTWTADLPVATLGLHPSAATFHLWTLAVEEQFYLLWPLALLVAVRRHRVGALLAVAGLGCAAATLATAWWARTSPDLAYALPTSWAGCFVAGAALQVVLPRRGSGAPTGGRVLPTAGLALGVLLLASALPLRGHWWTTVLVGPVIAAATCALITVAGSTPALLLLLAPLATLGTWSYAAYLWNYPATMWLRPHVPAAGLLAAALTLPLAWASTRFVERPALRRFSPRTAVAA
ncbi:MAG: acyltransferase [Kineosporiaceae bacterium]